MSDLEIPPAELGGLKARADAAFKAAVEARKLAEDSIVDDLTDELFRFLQDVLGLTRGDAAALRYERGSKSATARNDNDPSAPSNDITVEVKVDGVRLRGHYTKVQIMGKKSDSFGEEKVYGDEFRVECHNGRGWSQVFTLANLGALLS